MMLIKILKSLSSGDTYSFKEVAQNSGVSMKLLTPIMEDLTRRGYLETISRISACSNKCGGFCTSSANCRTDEKSLQKIWIITEEGLETAKIV